MTYTSPVVLFIGGPRNLQTEEISHPEPYIQAVDAIKPFIGLGAVEQEQSSFKVCSYRLEKYNTGAGIIIPMYVAQGTSSQQAERVASEYFLDLFICNHNSSKGPKSASATSVGIMQIMASNVLEQEKWYKDLLKPSKPIYYTKYKEDFIAAVTKIQVTAYSPSALSGTTVISQMTKLFPQLATTNGVCPSEDCEAKGRIAELIQHLNDLHQWQIETDIADWLETLDIKFEVKS